MRIDNLKQITLKKSTRTKQTNGTYINTYTAVTTSYVIHNPIDDEISASIYGNSLNKMTRITSNDNAFNTTILSKLNSTTDNIGLYYIDMDSVMYSIKAVKPYKKYILIDIEAI